LIELFVRRGTSFKLVSFSVGIRAVPKGPWPLWALPLTAASEDTVTSLFSRCLWPEFLSFRIWLEFAWPAFQFAFRRSFPPLFRPFPLVCMRAPIQRLFFEFFFFLRPFRLTFSFSALHPCDDYTFVGKLYAFLFLLAHLRIFIYLVVCFFTFLSFLLRCLAGGCFAVDALSSVCCWNYLLPLYRGRCHFIVSSANFVLAWRSWSLGPFFSGVKTF